MRLIKKGWDIWHIGFQRFGDPQTFGDGEGNSWTEFQAGSEEMGTPEYPNYLSDYMDKFDPDIILSLYDIYYIDEAIRQTNKRAVPYVSWWPVDNTNFSIEWLEKLKRISYPLTSSKFGKRVVMDTVEKHADGGWKYHFNIDYIYHGVDTDVFKRFPKDLIKENRKLVFQDKSRFPGGEDTFVYFFCGKNNRRKQLDRLLRAYAIVASKYRDVVLFLKIGDPLNVHHLGLDIGDIVRKLNIIDRVKILDKRSNYLDGITDVELAGWYNISDVHVSATSGEGFGLTTVESMACGKPVIIGDHSTSRELIGENGERGWLVPIKTKMYSDYNGLWELVDIEAMAKAMEDAYLHRKETQRRGNNGYRWVRKNCSWDIITDKIDKYLKKAIEEHQCMSEEDMKKLLDGVEDDEQEE
jgi:glycosyltransferase involved in cell wall biosynthesis